MDQSRRVIGHLLYSDFVGLFQTKKAQNEPAEQRINLTKTCWVSWSSFLKQKKIFLNRFQNTWYIISL